MGEPDASWVPEAKTGASVLSSLMGRRKSRLSQVPCDLCGKWFSEKYTEG